MNAIRLVLSDYDRTFTDGTLRMAPGLEETIRRLRDKGVLFSIVSGRKFSFMEDLFLDMPGLLDAFIAENGCVGYARGEKHVICDGIDQRALLQELKKRSVPFDSGEVVVSVHRRYEPAVDEIARRFSSIHVVRNIDSLMLLPRGASKAIGIRWLMGVYGVAPGELACIGDAENDLEMRDVCALMGAVSNALPGLKEVSDYVCDGSFGHGLKEFLEYIETKKL